MPVQFLLDNNIASYVIKGNFPHVRERLLKVPVSEVGISVVTEAELRFGVARLSQAAKLGIAVDEFLLRVEVLPWNSQAAQHYARLRAALEKHGEPMRQPRPHDRRAGTSRRGDPRDQRSRLQEGKRANGGGLESAITFLSKTKAASSR
jgi:predicted nucleic acid-binding protein